MEKHHRPSAAIVCLLVLLTTLATAPIANGAPIPLDEVRLPVTRVKNQGQSGTCWAFAITSMFEAELLRLNKGEHDLSEMYLVHLDYLDKFERSQKLNNSEEVREGNWPEQALEQIIHYGMITENEYSGSSQTTEYIDHEAMVIWLKKYAHMCVQWNGKQWFRNFFAFSYKYELIEQLGEIPDHRDLQGRPRRHLDYMHRLGLDPQNYLTLRPGSKKYAPYRLSAQTKDSQKRQFGIPSEQLLDVMEHILKQGYHHDLDRRCGSGWFQLRARRSASA